MLAAHGGSAKCVKVDGHRAYIEFSGGCQGCAGAKLTLGRYIASAIVKEAKDITEVLDATDHEAGKTPYYTEDFE
jgi:Fe/S biogenesis protein NfuA